MLGESSKGVDEYHRLRGNGWLEQKCRGRRPLPGSLAEEKSTFISIGRSHEALSFMYLEIHRMAFRDLPLVERRVASQKKGELRDLSGENGIGWGCRRVPGQY